MSTDAFYDFVDINSIKSVVSVGNLKPIILDAVFKPLIFFTLSILGHKRPIHGCCDLLIRDGKLSILNCEFLTSDCEPTILGLENLRMRREQPSLMATEDLITC